MASHSVLPRSSPGCFFETPSTRTSTSFPIRSRALRRPIDRCASMTRARRASFTFSGSASGHGKSGSPRPGIVVVHEGIVEPDLLHHAEGVVDIGLGLPGESNENIGRQRHSAEGVRGCAARTRGTARPYNPCSCAEERSWTRSEAGGGCGGSRRRFRQ